MDGVKVSNKNKVELMDYVGPFYKYGYWMILTRYMNNMQIYGLSTNYNIRKDRHQNKGQSIYID
jgi:hypothetical protein